MYTSQFPITVDGVRLDTLAYNIQSLDGRFQAPGVRGGNQTLPGRHGDLWTPHKKFEAGRLLLSMWVVGTDEDGNIPGGSTQHNEYRKNVDKLFALFTKRYGLLDIRKDDFAGNTRQAYGEVVTALSAETFGVSPAGKFTVELMLPSPFWQDLADSNYDLYPANGASPIAVSISTFVGATAPMEDLIVVVDGPINNPRIIDVATGHWCQLSYSLTTGEQWNLNTSTWSSKVGNGIAFTDGGTVKTTSTSFSGTHSPRYWGIAPTTPTGNHLIQLAHTGGTTSNTRLRIRGKRKFL